MLDTIKHITDDNAFFHEDSAQVHCVYNAIRFSEKCDFSCFPVLTGSAEAQVISGGKVKRLLIAYIIGNIYAKIYQNPSMCVKVIASQRWDVFLRHGVDWNSGVSVCTSTKSFYNFDLIWCVGRPRPNVRTSVSSTRSKVTELVKLRKLHFSRSISSAIFVWSSNLMVGSDSVGPSLQLRMSNFLLGKLSREFKLRGMSIFHEIQIAIFWWCVRLQLDG